jgi:hypothetical protein
VLRYGTLTPVQRVLNDQVDFVGGRSRSERSGTGPSARFRPKDEAS